ncbi:hypothetical protein NUW54_g4217 [Trametes sanguinea]|uniref:Uncharacterized protein n=1 Tax=Trametes sanguinea TaxID=158606 RepID=A0ACC1Q243_9APHY|nr:hypothetical protein NUW54_g4217 [Trametes sanguinea]
MGGPQNKGEIEWDWVIQQWGNSRTRHQILLKATSLGLKESTTRGTKRRREAEATQESAAHPPPPPPQQSQAQAQAHPPPQTSNIIKNVWAHIKMRLERYRPRPRNVEALWRVVQKLWYKVDISFIQALYHSLPGRVKTVKGRKGGNGDSLEICCLFFPSGICHSL